MRFSPRAGDTTIFQKIASSSQAKNRSCSRGLTVMTAKSPISADKQLNVSHKDIERSSFCVDKKKKRSKTTSVGCSSQVGVDKKVASKETERSSFDAKKAKERRKPTSASSSNQLSTNKKVAATEDTGRSSLAVKKGKKRSNAARDSCFTQTVASEQLAKKTRREPVDAPHCRKNPATPSFKNIVKEKKSQSVKFAC